MKTISIQRPWPEAIMRGEKTIECRNWKTDHRGILAIHVSLKSWCYNWNENYYKLKGAIIGTVELVKIIEFTRECNFFQLRQKHLVPMGHWTKYGWVFENPVPFATPIPYKGKLGLWNADLEEIK